MTRFLKASVFSVLAAALAGLAASCVTLPEDDEAQIAAIKETYGAKDEYFVGRSVTAYILSQYKVSEDQVLNEYVNMVGQVVALASDRPETYGGYRFVVLDSDEINAFAAPGGFVMVTRGLLKCCKSEDAVAAVLAHEVAHIQLYHGLLVVKQARRMRAFSRTSMQNTINTYGMRHIQQMNQAQALQLQTMLSTVMFDITRKLIVNGYSRKFETQADETAVKILRKAGYDEKAILDLFSTMKERLPGVQGGFMETHSSPDERIAGVKQSIGADSDTGRTPATQEPQSAIDKIKSLFSSDPARNAAQTRSARFAEMARRI